MGGKEGKREADKTAARERARDNGTATSAATTAAADQTTDAPALTLVDRDPGLLGPVAEVEVGQVRGVPGVAAQRVPPVEEADGLDGPGEVQGPVRPDPDGTSSVPLLPPGIRPVHPGEPHGTVCRRRGQQPSVRGEGE